MRYHKGAAVLPLIAALGMLAACGAKNLSIPEEYHLGEEQVPALEVGEGAHLTEQVSGENGEVYTYGGLASPGEAVEAYAARLTEADRGFLIVDDGLAEAEEPDYTAEEGEMSLAKNAEEEGKVLSLSLRWTQKTCVVTASTTEGAVASSAMEGMTQPEAVTYLKSLPPADLGLSGASMDAYEVYTMDGIILVDGRPCLQLSVYSKDNPGQTNRVSALYLLTGDKRHLYRLDKEAQAVEELSRSSASAGSSRKASGVPRS